MIEVILPSEGPALVLPAEQAYVTETPTGLIFREDTPIDLWGALTERLIRQHKRLEWAIGDALQFGERRYGDTYTAWVEETGLAENTLATIKWVAGKIEPLRRREDVGWSHHREVAALPPPVQDRLLDEAADKGLTRWEVRRAAKFEREKLEGTAVDVTGAPVETADLAWCPTKADLEDGCRAALESRLAEMSARLRSAYEAGWCQALVYAEALDCFTREPAP